MRRRQAAGRHRQAKGCSWTLPPLVQARSPAPQHPQPPRRTPTIFEILKVCHVPPYLFHSPPLLFHHCDATHTPHPARRTISSFRASTSLTSWLVAAAYRRTQEISSPPYRAQVTKNIPPSGRRRSPAMARNPFIHRGHVRRGPADRRPPRFRRRRARRCAHRARVVRQHVDGVARALRGHARHHLQRVRDGRDLQRRERLPRLPRRPARDAAAAGSDSVLVSRQPGHGRPPRNEPDVPRRSPAEHLRRLRSGELGSAATAVTRSGSRAATAGPASASR